MTATAPASVETSEVPETDIKEYERISAAQWAEAETLYERGVASGAQICAKYGIKPSTWKAHLYRRKREGNPVVRNSKVHELKKEVEKGVATAVSSAAASFVQKKRERIDKFREGAYVTGSVFQSQLNRILKDVSTTPAAGGTAIAPSDKASDIKAMLNLGKSMINNYKWVMKDVLEADMEVDEDQLPQLIFRDLTEEDLEVIRRNNGEDDDGGMGGLPSEGEEEIVEVGADDDLA